MIQFKIYLLSIKVIVYSYIASAKYNGKNRQKWMPEDGVSETFKNKLITNDLN